MKQELKAGEKELAELPEGETKAGRMHPDEILVQDPKRASRFAKGKEIANLKTQIVEAESRLPFHGKSNDDLVDQAAAIEADIPALREKVKAADDQLRTRGVADTSFATQQARRDLAEAESKLKPITAEIGYRKRDERQAAMQRDLEVRAVKRMRTEALNHWTAESRRLRADLDDPVRSQLLDYAELQTAEKNVREITEWNRRTPSRRRANCSAHESGSRPIRTSAPSPRTSSKGPGEDAPGASEMPRGIPPRAQESAQRG